jgi:hypothetical protein
MFNMLPRNPLAINPLGVVIHNKIYDIFKIKKALFRKSYVYHKKPYVLELTYNQPFTWTEFFKNKNLSVVPINNYDYCTYIHKIESYGEINSLILELNSIKSLRMALLTTQVKICYSFNGTIEESKLFNILSDLELLKKMEIVDNTTNKN